MEPDLVLEEFLDLLQQYMDEQRYTIALEDDSTLQYPVGTLVDIYHDWLRDR